MPKIDTRGEGNGNVKLTDDKVRDIRYLYEEFGYGYRRIQRLHPEVGLSQIRNIILKHAWRHIQ